MSRTPSTPEPGQILAGKYLVEEVLGVGGMGVVVAATHVRLDQRVAIKYLLPAALLNPEVVERFAREARAAAKIRGEHVARVIDVGQFDDGAPYMVMEHLDGHDLAKHLELHGALPIEDACRFMLETCEALAEAHAAKIVHRDLKPSNLFLAKQPDKSAIIKVLDFGISKTGEAPSASLTKTSALMGTAFYMSPEQLTSPKGVDQRSDIWTLGIILYELLTGQPPFVGESIPEIIGGILSNKPKTVRTHRPDVPVGLEAVIANCMRTKAADRYQSVASLAAAIGPFAHSKDRFSVEITARVLGESIRPPEAEHAAPVVDATLMAPTLVQRAKPSPFDAFAQAGVAAPAAPTPNLQLVDSVTARAVPAVTTQGLSSSTIMAGRKPRLALLAVFGGVVLVAVVGGVTVRLSARPDAASPAAAGLVPARAASPPPREDPAPTPPPLVVTSASAVAVAPAPAPPAVGAQRAAAGTVIAATKSGAAATANAVPASASAPPASTASSAPKNPLQMGIK